MAGVSIAEGEERGPPKQRTERKNKCGGVEAYGVFVARKGHVVLEGDESGWGGGACQGAPGVADNRKCDWTQADRYLFLFFLFTSCLISNSHLQR